MQRHHQQPLCGILGGVNTLHQKMDLVHPGGWKGESGGRNPNTDKQNCAAISLSVALREGLLDFTSEMATALV